MAREGWRLCRAFCLFAVLHFGERGVDYAFTPPLTTKSRGFSRRDQALLYVSVKRHRANLPLFANLPGRQKTVWNV